MEEEIWKDVVGYEGLYVISNFGQVKSLTVPIQNKLGRVFTRLGKNITVRLNSFGYLDTRLYKGGVKKSAFVHRLIAQAFIPNPDNKPVVNHINGINTDNNVNNLEWSTAAENMKHAVSINLVCPFCKKQVIDKCAGEQYPSIKEAAAGTNIPYKELKAILRKNDDPEYCLQLAA